MASRWIFAGLVGLLGLQRVLELARSRRNEAWIRARGGREHVRSQIKYMNALHASWFIAMLAEVFLLKRPFHRWLAGVALFLLGLGQSLRYAAIRALGRLWSVRVMTLPGQPPVEGGIYRYLRHPNYLGVALELLSVPLLHTAYLTASVWSIANAIFLYFRIKAEEEVLRHN